MLTLLTSYFGSVIEFIRAHLSSTEHKCDIIFIRHVVINTGTKGDFRSIKIGIRVDMGITLRGKVIKIIDITSVRKTED